MLDAVLDGPRVLLERAGWKRLDRGWWLGVGGRLRVGACWLAGRGLAEWWGLTLEDGRALGRGRLR